MQATSSFQSTLPHGSDLRFLTGHIRPADFNPRSLTGATYPNGSQDIGRRISIHAPSRERLKIFEPWNCVIAFQSTLPHGSDIRQSRQCSKFLNFNPRSLTGATGTKHINKINNFLFQSTLPHGSDIIPGIPYIGIGHFNPRSLTGATGYNLFRSPTLEFQSTLPHGSDRLG